MNIHDSDRKWAYGWGVVFPPGATVSAGGRIMLIGELCYQQPDWVRQICGAGCGTVCVCVCVCVCMYVCVCVRT